MPLPLRDRVTVVIVTRNRSQRLRGTLAQLAALPDVPATVVVDDASDEDIRAAIAGFADVEVVAGARHEGPVARNHGVRRARTPYLAFTDDDCWWAPGALERGADMLDRHPTIAVAAPRILVGE